MLGFECAECIRYGHWMTAVTLRDGTALCREHAVRLPGPAPDSTIEQVTASLRRESDEELPDSQLTDEERVNIARDQDRRNDIARRSGW